MTEKMTISQAREIINEVKDKHWDCGCSDEEHFLWMKAENFILGHESREAEIALLKEQIKYLKESKDIPF
jgi:hypothetical protein